MAYNYEFKYPRKKLREIVSRYLMQMHTMGRSPNCGVFFEERTFAAPDLRGWLLTDREGDGPEDRYVLLEDGDVWLVESTGDGHDEGRGWLTSPTDDLAVLLAQSLKSARMGGDGLLLAADAAACQVVVDDRRETMQAFMGREKRVH
jgi:hypothetical protein